MLPSNTGLITNKKVVGGANTLKNEITNIVKYQVASIPAPLQKRGPGKPLFARGWIR